MSTYPGTPKTPRYANQFVSNSQIHLSQEISDKLYQQRFQQFGQMQQMQQLHISPYHPPFEPMMSSSQPLIAVNDNKWSANDGNGVVRQYINSVWNKGDSDDAEAKHKHRTHSNSVNCNQSSTQNNNPKKGGNTKDAGAKWIKEGNWYVNSSPGLKGPVPVTHSETSTSSATTDSVQMITHQTTPLSGIETKRKQPDEDNESNKRRNVDQEQKEINTDNDMLKMVLKEVMGMKSTLDEVVGMKQSIEEVKTSVMIIQSESNAWR